MREYKCVHCVNDAYFMGKMKYKKHLREYHGVRTAAAAAERIQLSDKIAAQRFQDLIEQARQRRMIEQEIQDVDFS